MKIVLIALLGFLLGAEQPRKSDPPSRGGGSAPAAEEATEQEYEKLLEKDEATLQEIEKIFDDEARFTAQGTPTPKAVFQARIDQALQPMLKAYESFLAKHPEHVNALIAFGSFLGEIGDEQSAITHLEKARRLAPENPTPWNNLANIYGHIGPIRKAFHYYHRAIELNPKEPIYIQNLATTTYLFRKDAKEMYRISEDEVFDRALDLYRQALKLDPGNFLLATDLAQSYYGITPRRVDESIAAWNQALKIAGNDLEKEGVYLHLARIQVTAGRFEDAAKNLALVQHPELQDLKQRIHRNMEKKMNGEDSEAPAAGEDSERPARGAAAPARP